jgi:hypothetical protein
LAGRPIPLQSSPVCRCPASHFRGITESTTAPSFPKLLSLRATTKFNVPLRLRDLSIRGRAMAATGADVPADCHRSTRGLLRWPVPRGSSQRNPNAAVPETPTIRISVPRNGCPRRPPRRGRRGRCPVRRSAVSSTEVVVPVTAATPVGIVTPALVPEIARAPVMVVHGCRSRHRISGARSQAESGNGQATGHQRPSAQAKPRTCVRCCFPCHIHAARPSHNNCS